MPNHLILDIETIPDHSVWTPPPPEDGKEVFPPVYAHRPVVIGAVFLDSDLMPKKVGALKLEKGELDKAEEAMLRSFAEWTAKERPTIVTWYGRGFDMPCIATRCLKYGIPLSWYYNNKDFRYRFSETGHLDLCDAMSDYGAVRGAFKLDGIAKLIGLPGKPEGKNGEVIDGSKVESMFAEGRLDDIAAYCMTDCLQTAWVLMRWKVLQGLATVDMYKTMATALLKSVDAMPELAFFRKQIVPERLLFGESPQ
jgi:predicted PolB exonuclease-like 3'-5' exonuclease